MLKEGFKDPVLCRLRYMEQLKQMYQKISWGSIHINHMSGDDAAASILTKFTSLAKLDDD